MKVKHLRHLYWRAGFGIHGVEFDKLKKKNKTEIVDQLFKDSSSFSPLKVDTSEIDSYINSMESYDKKKFLGLYLSYAAETRN